MNNQNDEGRGNLKMGKYAPDESLTESDRNLVTSKMGKYAPVCLVYTLH